MAKTVALLGGQLMGWGGGVDFLTIIAKALKERETTDDISVKIVIQSDGVFLHSIKAVLRPLRYATMQLIKVKDFNIIKNVRKSWREKPDNRNRMRSILFRIDPSLEVIFCGRSKGALIKCLNNNKVDVCLLNMESLGNDFPVPWIAYIWDCQHRYLGEFFTEVDKKGLDERFSKILCEGKTVIVNAKSVEADLKKFYPEQSCKIFSLPFAPIPGEEWGDIKSDKVVNKYNINGRYFIVSNQFWMHKSHATVFRAMSILKKKGYEDIHLICTGKMEDFRNPEYINNLRKLIKELDIEECVHLLGFIPKVDQIALMKGAIAVVQPTLFEGGPGGGSVYNGVALGVRCIVSDIPVNLEIDDALVSFFKKESPEELSLRMIDSLEEHYECLSNEVLLKKGKEKLQNVGDTLLQAVNYTI